VHYVPRVSLCIIVKNEAHNLRDCVAPVADSVGDIVVVDTGSTDGTVEIARGLGARVFSFAWVDSFAAARNESLRHAVGDWVLWLDADDRVDEVNRGECGDAACAGIDCTRVNPRRLSPWSLLSPGGAEANSQGRQPLGPRA